MSARLATIFRNSLGSLLLLVCAGLLNSAAAEQIAFHPYAQPAGLTNLGLNCLSQVGPGYIFACTQHGLYAYDGQHFYNLGPLQGLPDGGIAHDLAVTPSGNLIVRYSDRLFVSTTSIGVSSPPETLLFHPAHSLVGPIFNDREKQLTAWGSGAIIIDQGRLDFVDRAAGKPTVIRSTAGMFAKPDNAIQTTIDNVFSLSGQGDTLWVGLVNGGICALGVAASRCFGPHEGLPAGNWTGFLPDGNGNLLVRSMLLLATIDLKNNRVSSLETLPNQHGPYANYLEDLFLKRTPSGVLMTQSADGLIVRDHLGWRTLTAANGIPPVPIISALFDHEKNLWLAVVGQGLLKALGYGIWENLTRQDGLSSSTVWQMTRQPGGPLWVATDQGIDTISDSSSRPIVHRHYDEPSYAVAASAFDHIWTSYASDGVSCITVGSGNVVHFKMPMVGQIVRGFGNRLWFSTEGGLYVVDDDAATPATPRHVSGLTDSVAGVAVAADGSLWILARGQLLHRHNDGTMVTVIQHWDQVGFDPLAIAVGQAGMLWIGGAGGGLYRIAVAHDRVASSTRFVPPNILSNTVVSVLVDKRGWTWAGTDNGISVFNGHRWVSADTGGGLVWNDLSQGGLFEDVQGSIWIGTSQGLSHISDPQKLFEPQMLQPVITSVMIGDHLYPGRAVAYSQEPLTLRFGALGVRSDVRFRYRVDGVDKLWADTAVGDARYPFVPAGHHRFTVVAYDPLTHQSSAPVSVLLRMKQPWWFSWPLVLTYPMAVAALIYALRRLREHYRMYQQRIVHREVEFRTKEIRAAQTALILQATQDSLTALLTRGEIQKRLVDALGLANQSSWLTIGLIDIDHFKRVNDLFGHLAGDEVLKEIGRRLKAALKPGEHGGRYGGEEILVVLAGEHDGGMARLRDLKMSISGEPFLIDGRTISVNCSIGVAQARPGDEWKSLIGRADRALYIAKSQGRNRIVEAEGEATRLTARLGE